MSLTEQEESLVSAVEDADVAHGLEPELAAIIRRMDERTGVLEAALREAAQYDSDEGPCFGMAPCCIADYGPGSRDRCRRLRAVLSPTTRKEDE